MMGAFAEFPQMLEHSVVVAVVAAVVVVVVAAVSFPCEHFACALIICALNQTPCHKFRI